MNSASGRRARPRGFSLLEMLLVVAVLMIVMAVILQQVNLVQKRYHTEEYKVDASQQGREFLDQMLRDIHQAGYPSRRMYTSGGLMNPWQQDARVAVGLVSYSPTDLWFEADVDGDGQVESVRYTLSAGNEGTCPCTLRRSQVIKVNATPPTSQLTSYSTGVDGVVNSGGAGGAGENGSFLLEGSTTLPGGATQTNQALYGDLASPAIFTAFNANGAVVPPTDINTDPDLLATVRSIGINLNVLVGTAGADFDTRLRAAVSLSGSAKITNRN